MADIASLAEGLKLGADGIWHGIDTRDISYPQDGNEVCFGIEDRSFWFKHRNRCLLAVVKAFPPAKGGALFDIGGGNGFVSRALETAGFDVVLVEPGLSGARNGRRRGLQQVICATTDSAGFKPGFLHAAGLFDVLEHIEDDLGFLKSLRPSLQEGGRLYLTVPAYSMLWSAEDETAGHYRRYSPATLRRVVEQAGFEVEFSTCIFRPLPIAVALFRALPHRLGMARKKDKAQSISRDHAVRGGVLASLLARVLGSEIPNLERRKAMRVGGSCLMVARRS